jgi:hypothetical protein
MPALSNGSVVEAGSWTEVHGWVCSIIRRVLRSGGLRVLETATFLNVVRYGHIDGACVVILVERETASQSSITVYKQDARQRLVKHT